MTITSAGRWAVDRKGLGEVSVVLNGARTVSARWPPGVGLADAAGQVRCWCAENDGPIRKCAELVRSGWGLGRKG